MPEHIPHASRDEGSKRFLTRSHSPPASRIPPQATEVEQSVLGAMLIEHAAIARAIEVLVPDAFYHPKHEKIYHAILHLFEEGSPVDLITLTEELRRRDELEGVGGAYYLTELTTRVASAANVEYHARIIAEKALLRKLIGTMTQRIADAYESSADAFELLDQAESDIFSISETQLRRGASSINDVLKDTFAHLESIHGREQGITGVSSGFRRLDDLTGGWQDSDLVIIAARPSMGKCLAYDSEVLQTDGSVRTIADIYAEQQTHLLSLGPNGRFVAAQPSAYLFDGLKPVFRVTTRLGRFVDTTLPHPFLTPGGWRPLSSLHPGNRIGVPRRLAIFGKQHLPKHDLEALALSAMRVPVVQTGSTRSEPSPGLPPALYTLAEEDLAYFLRCLLSHVKGKQSIEFAHYGTARQVQHLLVRFGLLSQIQDSRRLLLLGDDFPTVDDEAPDLYFDEITSIDALGVKPVFDLTIPGTHNFVANDICVHNTALALACARNAALHGQRPTGVAIFSLEMSAQQLAQRLLTSEARVNAQAARTGRLSNDDWPRLARAAGRLSNAPIYIDDTPGLGILELRAKCRRLKAEHNIGLVLVDYLQLMHGTMTGSRQINREQEIAHISRSLKSLAKELNIPVIALSQLNRSVETRGGDKRPQLSDLRESGSIEQDADVVAFIYRAERYGITTDENGNSTEGVGEIIIGKQRNGPTGTATLAFIREYALFENVTTYHAGALPKAQEMPLLEEDAPF